ncbi:MAG: IS66 family transposase [Hyphomicrobium sp.]
MALDPATLPDDISVLKAMLIASEARSDGLDAEIAHLKLTIAKIKRDEFGASSEKGARLIDQLEMQLGELVATASEGKAATAIERPAPVGEEELHKPARRALDPKLPRERIVHEAPCICGHCGSDRLRKLGETITETLEHVPEQWKVLSHVREKFTCRVCEKITETPAPSHPIARGRAGPQLLAEVLHNKYRAHLPLNRQSALYAAQGIDLDVSTMADWVGACAATLAPLVREIEKHVFAAERIHADDTTVPVLAKGRCTTGRLWAYVRDDAPFGGQAAPAALFHYAPTRGGEHPEKHLATYCGLMQADAYSGYNGLYTKGRMPGEIVEAACWAHGRRKFFELAELQKAPVAIEAVKRIDELFAIEREINGKPPDARLAIRQERSKPLVEALEIWLRGERKKLSSKAPVAKAIDYGLKRWPAFTRFLDDGRICMSNNAAERAVRGVAVGRKNWTFCGSDSGGRRAASIYTLIETCKLNDVDARAWLADVLVRIADHPAKRIAELLPWNWKAARSAPAQAA